MKPNSPQSRRCWRSSHERRACTGAPARPIAILGGTGPAGTGLALRWARAQESIIIGSRDAQRARDVAAIIRGKVGFGALVSGMENSAACAAADILMLTVPFDGQAALLKQLKPVISEGSILIDATVPLAAAVGGRASRTLGVWQGSAAQQAAELVPKGVSAGRGFSQCFRRLLNGDARRLRHDRLQRRPGRLALTRELAAKIPGVRAIDGGKLENRASLNRSPPCSSASTSVTKATRGSASPACHQKPT